VSDKLYTGRYIYVSRMCVNFPPTKLLNVIYMQKTNMRWKIELFGLLAHFRRFFLRSQYNVLFILNKFMLHTSCIYPYKRIQNFSKLLNIIFELLLKKSGLPRDKDLKRHTPHHLLKTWNLLDFCFVCFFH
jgi:hypothetical protein